MIFWPGLFKTFTVTLCAVVVLLCKDIVLLMMTTRAAVIELRCMTRPAVRIYDVTAQVLAVRVDPWGGMVEGLDPLETFYMASGTVTDIHDLSFGMTGGTGRHHR
jgi:hypothetical protein